MRAPAPALLILAALAVACAPASSAPPRADGPTGSPPAATADRAPEAETLQPTDPEPLPVTGDVLTDVRDVRACLPLDGGAVLAATGGGLVLVRADGTARAAWTALDGLPETRVHALLREGGTVWIGTEAGLAGARLAGEDLRVDRVLGGKPVRALARHGGAVVVATWGGGLARVDEKKGRLVAISAEEKRFGALVEHDGALFAGGPSGLYRVEDGRALPVAGSPRSLWALASQGGRLWIGSQAGLAWLDGGRFHAVSDADVRALAADGDALLAGTLGQGALEVREGRARPLPGLAGKSFVQAVGAAAGARCAGAPDGLFVQRAAGARWEAGRAPDLGSNDLSALALDGDRLWIGTFDRGLSILDGSRVTRLRDPSIDDKINGLAVQHVASGSVLWVASARGLSKVTGWPGSTAIVRYGEIDGLPSGDVHAVASLAGGGVLVGTARGAAIVRDGQITALGEKRGIPPGAVWAVAEGPPGTLLLGTSRGLLVGTAESRGVADHGAPLPADGDAEVAGSSPRPWLLLSMASGDLQDDWVTALAARGRTLYVGTYNAGVTRVTVDVGDLTAEQLGGGYVNFAGLLLQGHTLFAATMNGLLMRPAMGEGTWRRAPRGALGKDVTALAPAGGRLWVASRRGLLRFDPG